MELALELEVDDFSTDEGDYELYTTPDAYNEVREGLAEREISILSGELAMIPQTLVPLESDRVPKMLRFLEAMEELDDVQNVWANFDADEDALSASSAEA